MPMKIKAGICTLLMAVLVTGLLCSCGSSSNKGTGWIRTNTNNMQNERFVTTDGENLYYINDLRLCEWNLEAGETAIAELDQSLYGILQYVDGKLYYAGGIYPKIWNGETRRFEIIPIRTWEATECFQSDGEYFYTDIAERENYSYGETGLFRIKMNDLEDCEKLLDARPSKICLQGEYIYVMFDFVFDEDDDTPYRGTWRLDLDGGNPIQVLESCPEYFIVTEDRIYYSEEKEYYNEDGWSYYAEDVLHSMNLDGSEQYTYEDVILGDGLNVTDSYIFYVDYDTERIHRVTLDGTENIELNQSRSGPINVMDELLVYYNYDEGKLYAMDCHGLNSYCISS